MKRVWVLLSAIIIMMLLDVRSAHATSIGSEPGPIACGSRTRSIINNNPSDSRSWGSAVFIGMEGSLYKYQTSATQNYTWSTTDWVETGLSCTVPQGYGNPRWVDTDIADATDKIEFTYTALTSSQGAPAPGSSAWSAYGSSSYSQTGVIVGQTYYYYPVSGSAVPEPSTLLLLSSGIAGLALFKKKFLRFGGLKPEA